MQSSDGTSRCRPLFSGNANSVWPTRHVKSRPECLKRTVGKLPTLEISTFTPVIFQASFPQGSAATTSSAQ
ncbi:hypothetical protein DTO164E3_688 [Paecilomyces variotii]|nr:hypothetical protein DTO164E3_688 [Paecilomyces variotii]